MTNRVSAQGESRHALMHLRVQGAARWDRHSNTRIWEVETCTSASQYASSWNTCTGNFLRRCEPLLPLALSRHA